MTMTDTPTPTPWSEDREIIERAEREWPGPWLTQATGLETFVSWHRGGVIARFPFPDTAALFIAARTRWLAALDDRDAQEAQAARLREALRALVADMRDYERISNLAPNPGKDTWQSLAAAEAVLAEPAP